MERAGLAAAEHARRIMGERDRSVLVVAGPGNNGGDAFEVAARLKRWFYRVTVVFAGERRNLSGVAAAALAKWEAAGGTCVTSISPDQRWDLVIDGLFGIGLQRPLAGRFAELVDAMNALTVPILALDVPSGLNADTGAMQGAAIRATHTITFIGLKPGLLTLDGPDCGGVVRVETIGLDPEALAQADGRLLDASVLAGALGRRPANFHQGLAGDAVVLGGADGMVGAAVLAARAALKCGAGRVHLALLTASPPAFDLMQPELMMRSPEDLYEGAAMTVIAAGPGMGRSERAGMLLLRALQSPAPLVLDADALNALAENTLLRDCVAQRAGHSVLTPHPAEAARLLGCATREVQADRVAAAHRIAGRYRAPVALKGNGTVIAAPDGKWWINPTGNAGMAAAGMGDTLTGLIAGLTAQGASPLDALLAGVWLHGAAGDAAAERHGGPLGLTASDLIDEARLILNRVIYR
jgi:hydroxyethylthiazole kinase-like uncharacterized protein yjeF